MSRQIYAVPDLCCIVSQRLVDWPLFLKTIPAFTAERTSVWMKQNHKVRLNTENAHFLPFPPGRVAQLNQLQLICCWINHTFNHSWIDRKRMSAHVDSTTVESIKPVDNPVDSTVVNYSCFVVDSSVQSTAVETTSVCQLIYCWNNRSWINWKACVSPCWFNWLFQPEMIDSTAFQWPNHFWH